MKRFAALMLVVALAVLSAGAQTKAQIREMFRPMCDAIVGQIEPSSTMKGTLSVEKVAVKGGRLQIHFSRYISDHPMRYEDLGAVNSIISAKMPEKYREYRNKFEAYSNDTPLEKLVSRHASGMAPDAAAKGNSFDACVFPLVRRISSANNPTSGLNGRHIALWQSHGIYYDQSQTTWKWQRPRLFETCEDLFTQSFVLPFLVPMLENAGACVLLPRERDIQSQELIVDNDTNARGGIYSEVSTRHQWQKMPAAGFGHHRDVYHEGENPFLEGSARSVLSVSDSSDASFAHWEPEIEQDGEYAVYVSYLTTEGSTAQALYTVTHTGGETSFLVNQKMGGSTWIYLGTFGFAPNRQGQGVTLSNFTGREGEIVSADAVKFGGGMGNIARSPYPTDAEGRPRKMDFEVRSEISGYPRWCEGSRSWLQWTGMNDTIYSLTTFTDDYRDDYSSRARWVNALLGGTSRNPKEPGYNIPIDLSFAFHSDAGVTPNDSIVGTLSIYTKTSDGEDKYPHGGERTIGREYADMIQSQVVSDIRATMAPAWSRRGIWDKSYHESRVPHVPAMLLELLSHQNFADMRYGLNPNFRFVASRAVYKGMLKFLAYIGERDYVVQPLPVNSFAAEIEKSCVRLSWKPTLDPLEPTAEAESYIVYTRITDPDDVGIYQGEPEAGLDGFDNGTPVGDTFYKLIIQPDKIYSFKVAAVNAGGESLCSEILSVGLTKGSSLANTIIVNNFDRVAAPASFASSDGCYAGFVNSTDGGVAYLRDISFTGEQYEFRRSATHLKTEPSYFGASYGDWETTAIAGNSFDYPLIHGAALLKAGCSFTSASREAVSSGAVNLRQYKICDLVCGKQVRTPQGWPNGKILYNVFPAGLRTALSEFTRGGGALLVSGAYIASDCRDQIYDFQIDGKTYKDEIEPEVKFTEEVLKYTWITNKGGANGQVRTVQSPFKFTAGSVYGFYNRPNQVRYCVESPDGIAPAKNAFTIMRYADSGISAAVAYRGSDYRCICLGFPLETLTSQRELNSLVKEAVGFLK